MEDGIIRHWIDTPVRYQHKLAGQDLTECKLDHLIFALPGPTEITEERDKLSVKESEKSVEDTEVEKLFRIMLDVVQFRPEDIIIQVFEGWLIIRAQHGRRMDEHGFISRSFTRQYKLPDGVLSKDLSALLCHDGILVVKAKT
ncbi:heat shock protein beta-3 [Chiloscyllium plagiosum]|uniref:heat shock protein beta-3 n=1 Tax=Chiloscyllium plagiosum TaxID=36176 RepID=UPI001CB8559A|nr:heat shock protein beta-3 [Chiloscyllium plagiosum]